MTAPPLSEARERLEAWMRDDIEPAIASGKSLVIHTLPPLRADLFALFAHLDAQSGLLAEAEKVLEGACDAGEAVILDEYDGSSMCEDMLAPLRLARTTLSHLKQAREGT